MHRSVVSPLLLVVPALAVVALAVVAPRLAAQGASADTLPFRAGQWGLEGSVSGSGVGAGLLRFVSPRTALTFDASVSVNASTSEQPIGTGTAEQTERNGFGSLRLGVRRYRPVGNAVAAIVGGGASVGYGRGRSESDQAGGSAARSSQTAVGVFADAGAMLFVTPRLGVSALYELTASRSSSRTRFTSGVGAVPTVRRDGWNLRLGGVSVNVSLFF